MGKNWDVKVFLNDRQLKKGDVITGADVADVYMVNGIVKYYPVDDSTATGWLSRWTKDANDYVDVFASEGDGCVFVMPSSGRCDRLVVIESTPHYCELAAVWDAWDFAAGYFGPGVQYVDWVGSGMKNYELGETDPAAPKLITEAIVTKTSILKRGMEGVEYGIHSDPLVGPHNRQLPAQNNNTNWGERELQCSGGGARVSWSSAGVRALHPDFGSDAIWGTSAGGANYAFSRHAWMGIDDPNYPPYSNPTYVSSQIAAGNVNFPHEQTEGPWWVAELSALNGSTFPFCMYLVMRSRSEIGAVQFSSSAYARNTLHSANETRDGANVLHRTTAFIAAFPYSSADLSLEPVPALNVLVTAKAAQATAAFDKFVR